MAVKLSVNWSERSETDLDQIYNYLLNDWGIKEANVFLDLVQEFENLICKYSEAFAFSKKSRIPD